MNQLIHFYQKDTSGVSQDSVINLLENSNSLQAKYRLTMTYFEQDDTISAMNIFGSIPDQFQLDASQTTLHQHWADFLGIIRELKRDSIYMNDLDSIQLATLMELSLFENLPGSMSRNILHYIEIAETGPYYLLPEDQLKSDQTKPIDAINLISNKGSFLKIYPNPAKNYLILEYKWENDAAYGLLSIYTSEGRLKYSKTLDEKKHDFIINTRNWNQGIYFYKFVVQGDIVQNGKIIILK